MSSAALFTPKLVTVLREGYGGAALRADAVAGLTVAIVALPLSMAIAIASGVSPDRGLYTAIVGGFLVSALGGSRFQVGGPAGAFIVLVAATVARHGIEGLILATFLSGLILMAIGGLRLGTYIKFIPYPVTVGFTAGIATIIFASQIAPLLGLRPGVAEPGPILQKLPVLWTALPTLTPAACAVSLATIGLIVGLRRWRPHWPGLLIAIGASTLGADLLGLPVETIQSRFGGIPSLLPAPALPSFRPDLILAVLPDALAFAMLGAIESLLSAVVADSMTGRRHRSNAELVAQGVANLGSALFGGFCVTGTIARTATNVRSGAHGPVAGMLHSAFLLGFMLVAAPLAGFIPLAALAGVLATVAWNMAERHAVWRLLKGRGGDALVLLVTLLLTIFRDLTEAIIAGFSLGALIFIHRMSQVTEVSSHAPALPEDQPDGPSHAFPAAEADVVIQRISGAFFFGAAGVLDGVLDRIGDRHRALILDFSDVPLLDSSGAQGVGAVLTRAAKRGIAVYLAGTTPAHRRELALLEADGLRLAPDIDAALADWRGTVSAGRSGA